MWGIQELNNTTRVLGFDFSQVGTLIINVKLWNL